LAVIRRFGYLQVDTVAVSGARSHAIVLMSRLEGFAPSLGEQLLTPGLPLFEYWGHEASWIPLELYPAFEFRRQEYRHHPWWGDVLGENPGVAAKILERIRDEGPLRSLDLDGKSGAGWNVKLTKMVALALWSRGDLAIRERRNFQRIFDLAERVIPSELRQHPQDPENAIPALLLRALAGHGWAQTGTLAATWRFRNMKHQISSALIRMRESGEIVACELVGEDGERTPGWIRSVDLDLGQSLARLRPRMDRGVLLSPFDPLLWDRPRVKRLFDFHQVLEIFKPKSTRIYGYYCLPVMAGDQLIARVDLKAHPKSGDLEVLALHHEKKKPSREAGNAVSTAIARHAGALQLTVKAGRKLG